MRVPLKWLSEYVDLTLDPRELAERLTMAGVEVGQVITTAGEWDGISVAQVVDVARHPNADRLRLAPPGLEGGRPARGGGGAPPARPPVLRPAVIRGVESAGMICSEKELGLSDYHEGILVLADDAPVGAPLASYLGDAVFDLELTPNRPDLLSVVGGAREVAAVSGVGARDPPIEYQAAAEPIKGRARGRIEG